MSRIGVSNPAQFIIHSQKEFSRSFCPRAVLRRQQPLVRFKGFVKKTKITPDKPVGFNVDWRFSISDIRVTVLHIEISAKMWIFVYDSLMFVVILLAAYDSVLSYISGPVCQPRQSRYRLRLLRVFFLSI